MATTNILANLFTTLFNTEDRRKDSCIVVPTSKLAIEVLNTLKKEGYIAEFEHIDIPGIKYDPKIGILGLDVSISLKRPGYNIRLRSNHKAKIGHKHRITKNDSIEFFTKNFGVKTV